MGYDHGHGRGVGGGTRNLEHIYCTFVARLVLLSFSAFIEVAAVFHLLFLEDCRAAGFEVHELSHPKRLPMAAGKVSTCIEYIGL